MPLSIVYPPKDAIGSPSVDIIAVHGLGGNLTKTWTHPTSKAFWLKDFLPRQIPDARIMTFGYNADVAFGKSTAKVVDHAKSLLSSLVDKREESEETTRPLIFIAHSLGGIVVKQALYQARLELRYQLIHDATLGLIFFGTPHRGSEKAAYGKILVNVARFMTHKPPSSLLAALRTNSDDLLRLNTDFRFQLSDYHVCSFYEQAGMKGFSGLIVEKHSALLEVDHEEQIPVDADHSAMCKFETDSDETFEKVCKRVQRMRKDPRPIVCEQSASGDSHFEVPHLLSPVFTGRDEVLQSLSTSFASRQLSHVRHQRRFVLFGLGGSGKTQICLKYVQKYRERYWGIFWVDASTDDRIRQCFTQIARLLQLEEDVDSVKRRLANISQAWLLVFDNADDPDLSLTPYLPAGERGDIIITSRRPGHQQYNTVGCKEIGQLSLNESVSLLDRTIHGEIGLSSPNAEGGENIVEALGCLALAITQAGAYIRETCCTLQEYLEIYERRKVSLLEYRPKHCGTDYQYSVYTTWQVSVDMIKSRHDATSDQTLQLLKLLGFYHRDQIPVQMFYNAWHSSQDNTKDLSYLPWHDSVSDLTDYRQSVRESINLLASFSLIIKNTDTSLSLHPLVHEWCRDRICDEGQRLSYRKARLLLINSVEFKFRSEDYTFRRSLVPHMLNLFRLCYLKDGLTEVDEIQEKHVLGLIHDENGRTAYALHFREKALELCKSKFEEDHPDTLRSMHSLAMSYSEIGRGSEGLQLMEQVLKLRKSKLEEDHPDILRSMQSLAILYRETGQESEGLQLMEQVLKLRKSKLGEDHPETLQSMHDLAFYYWFNKVSQKRKAIQLMEQVVKVHKSRLGEAHPETLQSMHDLAYLYRFDEIGQKMEATQLMERVVKWRKVMYEEDHPDTLQSMHNLAFLYGCDEIGRKVEATQLMEQLVKLREGRLGEDHPDTLESMHDLACFYGSNEIKRKMEATQLMEQVVELRKSRLGEDHRDTLESMAILANLAEKIAKESPRSSARQRPRQLLSKLRQKLRALVLSWTQSKKVDPRG